MLHVVIDLHLHCSSQLLHADVRFCFLRLLVGVVKVGGEAAMHCHANALHGNAALEQDVR